MIAVRVDGDSRTNGELMERFYEGHSRCKADCSHFCSFCFWRPWRVVQSILLRLVSHGVTLDEQILNNLPTDKNHYLFIIVRFTTVLLRPHRTAGLQAFHVWRSYWVIEPLTSTTFHKWMSPNKLVSEVYIAPATFCTCSVEFPSSPRSDSRPFARLNYKGYPFLSPPLMYRRTNITGGRCHYQPPTRPDKYFLAASCQVHTDHRRSGGCQLLIIPISSR